MYITAIKIKYLFKEKSKFIKTSTKRIQSFLLMTRKFDKKKKILINIVPSKTYEIFNVVLQCSKFFFISLSCFINRRIKKTVETFLILEIYILKIVLFKTIAHKASHKMHLKIDHST